MATSAPELEPNTYQTVMSNAQRKRKRQGSLAVETLNSRSDSSESESDMQASPRPNVKSRSPINLKTLIVPIDKTKSLKNLNPIAIARAIKECVGQSPVKYIRHTFSGIIVECNNQKQQLNLNQIEAIGNIPVKIQEKAFGAKGVISGISEDLTDTEIEQELKGQKVIAAKRITRKRRTNNDRNETDQAEYVPTRSIILTFNKENLPDIKGFTRLPVL